MVERLGPQGIMKDNRQHPQYLLVAAAQAHRPVVPYIWKQWTGPGPPTGGWRTYRTDGPAKIWQDMTVQWAHVDER